METEFGSLQRFDKLNGKTLLICVGAMKCATSWLHTYLGMLPGIAVSPVKELHFFSAKFAGSALSDMDALAMHRLGHHLQQEGDPVQNLVMRPAFQASIDRVQMIYDDDAYFGHFARLCTEETRTLCDITPAYQTIGPEGFAYMRDFCATQDIRVKILFVMRDPVERLWSQLRHISQANPDTNLTVNWSHALELPRIMVRTDYHYTVVDIDNTFPAEDVLYLFFEDLFQESSLRRLCDFTGVDYRPGDTDVVQNQTLLKLDLPDDVRDAFRCELDTQYAFCNERFGEEVPASWKL